MWAKRRCRERYFAITRCQRRWPQWSMICWHYMSRYVPVVWQRWKHRFYFQFSLTPNDGWHMPITKSNRFSLPFRARASVGNPLLREALHRRSSVFPRSTRWMANWSEPFNKQRFDRLQVDLRRTQRRSFSTRMFLASALSVSVHQHTI